MCAKPIFFKNSERRCIPAADSCPKPLSAGREGCFDHSASGFCCVAVALKSGKDLKGDFRLIVGRPTHNQSAITNRVHLFMPSDTQYSEAVYLRLYVPSDHSLRNLIE